MVNENFGVKMHADNLVKDRKSVFLTPKFMNYWYFLVCEVRQGNGAVDRKNTPIITYP